MTRTNEPSTPPRWTRRKGNKTLGVIMIVRNEAKNLPALFHSITDLADEVVVVDTGSTDGTQGICKAWGVKLLHDPWHDDFSRARNRSIDGATARYLLWLDGDDRVPAGTRETLARLRDDVLPTIHDRAYLFRIYNTNAAGERCEAFLQTRLFPRRPGVRFEHAIHEQIAGSLMAAGVTLVKTELVVEHTGYASREHVLEKARRNEALLRRALEQDAMNLHYQVHMAQVLAELGRFPEADAALSDAIRLATDKSERPEHVAELHALRAVYRARIGNRLAAIYDLEQAIGLYEEWGIPHAALAEIHMREGDTDAAWEAVARACGKSFVPGMIGFPVVRMQSNVELFAGRMLRRRGDLRAAVDRLDASLALDRGNLNARLELGQALLESEEYEKARAVLEPAGADEAALTRFVDLSAAIGLARAMTGDMAGAGACLAPLLDIFTHELNGAQDVSAMELAEVMLKAGYGSAASNMVTLFQKTAAVGAA